MLNLLSLFVAPFLLFYFFTFLFHILILCIYKLLKLFFNYFRDVVDGLGVSGCEGTFRKSSEQVLRVLRENTLQVLTYK